MSRTETTAVQQYESGLADDKHNALAQAFNPFAADVQKCLSEAAAITVTDETDVGAMKLARDGRLKLRRIRIDVENTRKGLKESSMREGKAIDGMANIIKFMIVPVEEDLQAKEDFVKLAREKRAAELADSRAAELGKFDADSTHFDLAGMSDEAYAQLVKTSELGHNARIKAEKDEAERVEAERIAEAKAEAEREKERETERKRIEAENAELKKQADKDAKERAKAEAARKKAEAETKRIKAAQAKAEAARKKAEAETKRIKAAQAKKDDDEKTAELKRIQAEKDAEQAALSAPDADKIKRLDDDVCALTVPSVSSDVALTAIHEVRGLLNGVVKRLRDASKELKKADK